MEALYSWDLSLVYGSPSSEVQTLTAPIFVDARAFRQAHNDERSRIKCLLTVTESARLRLVSSKSFHKNVGRCNQ